MTRDKPDDEETGEQTPISGVFPHSRSVIFTLMVWSQGASVRVILYLIRPFCIFKLALLVLRNTESD